jgi:DNA polymerase-3 subunit alpha
MIDFCHLHIHTEYSTLDGFGKPEAYAKRAKALGHKYLACTDHGNIDGLIKFQKACEAVDIIPIHGCEVYLTPEVNKERKNGHCLILVKNARGFRNLCRMLSFANTEGFYYKPRITYDMLLNNCKGLVVATACVQSFIYMERGEILWQDLNNAIGDDLYFEIMPHKGRIFEKHNKNIIRLANKFNKKVIATNDCHYINRNEWKAQEVLLAIQRRAKWSDKDRFKFTIKGLHLRTAQEMKKHIWASSISYRDEWLTNTIEVAEKCSQFRIKPRPVRLPAFENLKPEFEGKLLRHLCYEGFKHIFKRDLRKRPEYYKRFLEEYRLIVKKEFVRYFLIVKELVEWCKENDIMVGPGRGSVGGSLIAYLLGITTIDPLKFGLIFSRFIAEDRIDYPDIDIDFEPEKRDLIRKHLEDQYGEGNIAAVSTFNRMKSRAVVRDVSRVFDIDIAEVNQVTKLIDPLVEDGIQRAIDEHDEARDFADSYPQVIKLAKQLEGQIRAKSTHAAGLIVSRQKLNKSNRCNLIERDGATLINWEMNDAEYVGLMKLDILAINLISILAETKRLVIENQDIVIEFEKIPLDDNKVLKEIGKGNNVGLFQLNAWATNNVIKEIGAENFMQIPLATALSRPGPANSGMTEEFIRRKKSKRWDRKHKIFEDICKDTFGVIVFQEQVMNVIHKVAGLPYSTADKIRKVIGKKRDAKEFAPYKKQFVRGCLKQGYFDRDEANDFWHTLQSHASYSFNLAHSVAYGMLGYWTGYLKCYYPTEFICASLTYGAKDKKAEMVEESYRLGLTLVTPRITGGYTKPNQWIAKDKKLYIPFTEVKGIGEKRAQEAIKVTLDKRRLPTFFDNSKKEKVYESKFEQMLDTIGAFRENDNIEVTPELKEFFDFRLTTNPRDTYPNLFKIFNHIRLTDLDRLLQGDIRTVRRMTKALNIIHATKFKGFHKFEDRLADCDKCKLRAECSEPVPPSIGRYNISLVGEAPGFEEDREGRAFYENARAGSKLWDTINKAGYNRTQFHISNFNKCYPSVSRNPGITEIKKCSNWITTEFRRVKPIFVLSFGNSGMQFFQGKKAGITQMSGKVEWHDRFKCWVCYCLHPAAVLHNPDNMTYYKAGMKAFFKFLNAIGGPELR